MSDIMHEIKDDLRQQQLKAFWQENRDWIIGGVILAIVLTGGMSYWRSHQAEKNMQRTSAMLQVLNTGDPAAISAFAQSGGTQAVLARFAAAGAYLQKNQTDEAIAVYQTIEKQRGADKVLRDLAKLQRLILQMSTADTALMQSELASLASDKNPLRFTAMEMQALLFARDGKTEQAMEKLAFISGDAQAPQDVRMRAFTLRELYAGNAAVNKGEGEKK